MPLPPTPGLRLVRLEGRRRHAARQGPGPHIAGPGVGLLRAEFVLAYGATQFYVEADDGAKIDCCVVPPRLAEPPPPPPLFRKSVKNVEKHSKLLQTKP